MFSEGAWQLGHSLIAEDTKMEGNFDASVLDPDRFPAVVRARIDGCECIFNQCDTPEECAVYLNEHGYNPARDTLSLNRPRSF